MERQRVIRMKTICGINCKGCNWKKICKGCVKTDGHPFGGECVTAECYKSGGKKCYPVGRKLNFLMTRKFISDINLKKKTATDATDL